MDQKLPVAFIELLFDKLDREQFQVRFLKALMNTQNVERGSIWIKKSDKYVCSEAMGAEAAKVKGFSISTGDKSIVGSVFETGKMTIAEPGKDKRHFKGIEDILDLKNTLILCFPLTLKGGEVYGAVQILDTTAEGSRLNLNPSYLQLLEDLVSIGGIALSTSMDFAEKQDENIELKKLLDDIRSPRPIIGQSESFLTVRKTAEVYAANDFPVMLTGESGTGKELVAKEIHHLSSRKGKPFLVQNCSAIPDNLLESELFGYKKGAFTGADRDKVGLFVAADDGTVFLDEIGDMPMGLQAKILGVLQSSEVKPLGTTESRKIDVRIISATNKDLSKSIASGAFREDLFFRLRVLPLDIPPVRMRKDDIPLLLTHFLEHYSALSQLPSKTVAPEVLQVLMEYRWPGNVREMENLVKYLITVTQNQRIGLADLPPPYHPDLIKGDTDSKEQSDEKSDKTSSDKDPRPMAEFTWEELECAYILSLMDATKWNIAAASRKADVKRTTFSSRMRKLGIGKTP